MKEFNTKRVIDATAKFIQFEGGNLNHLKLMKYLYLLEREAMTKLGISISNDSFSSMKHGPVLSHTLDLIRNHPIGDTKVEWDSYINNNGYRLSLAKEPDFKSLSKKLNEIIENLVEEHREKDKYQLRDYVHDTCPEWKPTESSLPLRIDEILQASGEVDDDNISKKENQIDDAAFLLRFK
jgi:uncharacterized phage-associated protein